MSKPLQSLIAHQYEASLCMLALCVDRCPSDAWNTPVANLKFCQVVFHTLFFTDHYLEQSNQTIRDQQFHRDHAEFFGDYEELQHRPQRNLYDRETIGLYLSYCRTKAGHVVNSESLEDLEAPCRFPTKSFSRAELHVYNIRHIQHHGAQLSLRLRLDHEIDIPWVGSGWCEF